jgi:tRNA uracil 4-sulfurtransferase
MPILIHYGELALKGRNRGIFEKRLIENIRKVVAGRIVRFHGRIVVESDDIDALKRVFGISWMTNGHRVEKDLESIKNLVLSKVLEISTEGIQTFGVFVKRADKSFPYTSVEVGDMVGREVVDKLELRVNLRSPDLKIYIEIAEEVFVFFEKLRGLGGLPVGISGRVLCMLSGGIDSPVAAYLMMKRGCSVDYMHFYNLSDGKSVLNSKIIDLVNILNRYQDRSKLHLVPFKPFQMEILMQRINSQYELVLFRRFMAMVAERVAMVKGYRAIVTGDSLGQVASQTLENLCAVDDAVSLPVFRPLISYDKQEIIDISKRIGTYEHSLRGYKDCCSLLSSRPATKADLGSTKAIEGRLDVEEVVKRSAGLIEEIELSNDRAI